MNNYPKFLDIDTKYHINMKYIYKTYELAVKFLIRFPRKFNDNIAKTYKEFIKLHNIYVNFYYENEPYINKMQLLSKECNILYNTSSIIKTKNTLYENVINYLLENKNNFELSFNAWLTEIIQDDIQNNIELKLLKENEDEVEKEKLNVKNTYDNEIQKQLNHYINKMKRAAKNSQQQAATCIESVLRNKRTKFYFDKLYKATYNKKLNLFCK